MTYKKAVNITVGAQIVLVMLLSLVGFFEGVMHEIAYILAFLIPLAIGLFLVHREERGVLYPMNISGKRLKLFLPTVFPTILLIIGISLLTSFILSLFGKSNEFELYEGFIPNVLRHALLTAVLEEAVFRYLPLITIGRYSNRATVILSASLFALIHCNLFQIPYAFVAGVLFMTLDIMAASVLPSLILHFLNNLISVISMYYHIDLPIIIAVGALALLSLIPIIKKRKIYASELCGIFEDEKKFEPVYTPLIIAIPTLIIAILNL